MTTVDLNSDLGEGYGIWSLGDDAAMLDLVTSANVACGFHAGDPSIMRRTCELAAARGVVIGAQVSYPDRDGFGRRFIDIDPGHLADAVVYQIGALDACARAAGTAVRYVKPHGALYNTAVHHESQATAIVDGIRALGDLPVLGLPGSALLRAASAAGLRAVPEAFADRGYRSDGTLVPRSEPGAVLHDVDQVAERAVQMAVDGRVVAADGTSIDLFADSICIHGDTPGAVQMGQAVRAALAAAGIQVTPFL